MYDYYFTFRSVTAATRAGKVLERARVPNHLVRTPKQVQELGCGYSLRIKGEDLPHARMALQQEKESYHRIFRKGRDGNWQEVGT